MYIVLLLLLLLLLLAASLLLGPDVLELEDICMLRFGKLPEFCDKGCNQLSFFAGLGEKLYYYTI